MDPPDIVRRYTSSASAIDTLRRRKLALLDPQSWDDRNDRHFMALYKEHRGRGRALCALRDGVVGDLSPLAGVRRRR